MRLYYGREKNKATVTWFHRGGSSTIASPWCRAPFVWTLHVHTCRSAYLVIANWPQVRKWLWLVVCLCNNDNNNDSNSTIYVILFVIIERIDHSAQTKRFPSIIFLRSVSLRPWWSTCRKFWMRSWVVSPSTKNTACTDTELGEWSIRHMTRLCSNGTLDANAHLTKLH